VVGEGFSAAMDTHIHTFIQAKHLSDIPAKQLSDIQAKHLFEACRHLHEAESRINRQQKLAEKLQRQGHARRGRCSPCSSDRISSCRITGGSLSSI